jgi:3'-5' exoribonuclease 1
MHKHSVLRDGISFPPIFYRWVNIRKVYAAFFKVKPLNIGQMLTRQGLTFSGRQHSGIDDARNIARLVVILMEKGCRLSAVSSVPVVDEADRLMHALLLEEIEGAAAKKPKKGGNAAGAKKGAGARRER